MEREGLTTEHVAGIQQDLAELDQTLLEIVAGGLRAQGMDYDN